MACLRTPRSTPTRRTTPQQTPPTAATVVRRCSRKPVRQPIDMHHDGTVANVDRPFHTRATFPNLCSHASVNHVFPNECIPVSSDVVGHRVFDEPGECSRIHTIRLLMDRHRNNSFVKRNIRVYRHLYSVDMLLTVQIKMERYPASALASIDWALACWTLSVKLLPQPNTLFKILRL